MSNAVGTQARREEEIAFLAMENVLGVDIKLADAYSKNKMPDGIWVYPEENHRQGIVEVTSPPAEIRMRERAIAKRAGQRYIESGSIPIRWGELAQVCAEMLEEDWAKENIDKLLAQPAEERHLFLFGRGYEVENHFHRLSDTFNNGEVEPVDDLILPEGISDVWFEGRARRVDDQLPARTMEIWLARFQASSGWHRYVVEIQEKLLPGPNRSIADDPAPKGSRQPRDRTVNY